MTADDLIDLALDEGRRLKPPTTKRRRRISGHLDRLADAGHPDIERTGRTVRLHDNPNLNWYHDVTSHSPMGADFKTARDELLTNANEIIRGHSKVGGTREEAFNIFHDRFKDESKHLVNPAAKTHKNYTAFSWVACQACGSKGSIRPSDAQPCSSCGAHWTERLGFPKNSTVHGVARSIFNHAWRKSLKSAHVTKEGKPGRHWMVQP